MCASSRAALRSWPAWVSPPSLRSWWHAEWFGPQGDGGGGLSLHALLHAHVPIAVCSYQVLILEKSGSTPCLTTLATTAPLRRSCCRHNSLHHVLPALRRAEHAVPRCAAAGDDHAVLLWDTRSGTDPVLRVTDAHGAHDVHCVDWSRQQDNLLVTGGQQRSKAEQSRAEQRLTYRGASREGLSSGRGRRPHAAATTQPAGKFGSPACGTGAQGPQRSSKPAYQA